MLKRCIQFLYWNEYIPAAFRRLCVETSNALCRLKRILPAAFRRLCVETLALISLTLLR